MARYLATGSVWLKPSREIRSRRLKAGEIFEYDGLPGSGLAPLDAAAITSKRAYAKSLPSDVREGNEKKERVAIDRMSSEVRSMLEKVDAELRPDRPAPKKLRGRYRLIEGSLFTGRRLIKAGEEIEYEGMPAIGMAPLDAPGRAAKLASIPKSALNPRARFNARLITLAKSLGAGNLPTYDAYREFIHDWIARETTQEN